MGQTENCSHGPQAAEEGLQPAPAYPMSHTDQQGASVKPLPPESTAAALSVQVLDNRPVEAAWNTTSQPVPQPGYLPSHRPLGRLKPRQICRAPQQARAYTSRTVSLQTLASQFPNHPLFCAGSASSGRPDMWDERSWVSCLHLLNRRAH